MRRASASSLSHLPKEELGSRQTYEMWANIEPTLEVANISRTELRHRPTSSAAPSDCPKGLIIDFIDFGTNRERLSNNPCHEPAAQLFKSNKQTFLSGIVARPPASPPAARRHLQGSYLEFLEYSGMDDRIVIPIVAPYKVRLVVGSRNDSIKNNIQWQRVTYLSGYIGQRTSPVRCPK